MVWDFAMSRRRTSQTLATYRDLESELNMAKRDYLKLDLLLTENLCLYNVK